MFYLQLFWPCFLEKFALSKTVAANVEMKQKFGFEKRGGERLLKKSSKKAVRTSK